jgi:hypothetical protein
MQFDVRPVARLRGPSPLDVPAALGPLFEALSVTSTDLTRLKVVCDWIQYRSSFAEPVRCRPDLADRPVRDDPIIAAEIRELNPGMRTRRRSAGWNSLSTCAAAPTSTLSRHAPTSGMTTPRG